MNKKSFKLVTLGLALISFFTINEIALSKTNRLAIGTSTPGGNYYLVGGGWSNVITNNSPDIEVTAEVTGGSTANLTMIQTGKIDIGVTMGSTIIESIEAKEAWTQGKPKDKIRILLPLYPSAFTIYSLEKYPIKDINEIHGKKVGTGNLGAGVDSIAKSIFKELNITPKQIHNDSHNNTVGAVGDEIIDAGISFQYPPYPALLDLESSKNIFYTSLTEDELNKIVTKLPFLSKGTIPKGSYKGASEDINTVIDWNWLVCSADMSEEVVYNLVKTTFENKDTLLTVNKALENIQPENYTYAKSKLHPGVIKYLKEINIVVPNELIP
ncbi:TAXI family TRAP transporter solute-binding subunit [Cetobacterium sp. 2A]|uniref:TAXI family TRAP transporter solute-binding subunit n=1 Tax=Cetobacterium sp. 2A TaxID=2754723 RepID=UPI00163BB8C1|nr:TAXI family TRAP transporter solute-binding subunit [Cetobacterium sp. 2A]MBC2854959.1 TAXI family TRAP transporter solute-binding subunit [Cetobacterium sp. 2A]